MIKETLKHHGRPINKETEAIFCVNRVFEETFVPSLHNPMQEPIEPGQYVAWKRSNIVEDEEENTTHRRVRLVAREGYLKAARRQDSRYQSSIKEFVKEFEIGCTVGIRIHQADRTNTDDARLLPCKILDIKQDKDPKLYQLYSAAGIINSRILNCPSRNSNWSFY